MTACESGRVVVAIWLAGCWLSLQDVAAARGAWLEPERAVQAAPASAGEARDALAAQPPSAGPVSPDLGQATVDLRRLAGVGATILGALLLLLYVHRRRPYILEWTAAWTLLAGAMFVVSATYRNGYLANAAVGLSEFLRVSSALLFVLSADRFRQARQARRASPYALLPLLIWFLLAPLALGPAAALVPGRLFTAGALGAAAFGYLSLLRRTPLLGAGVLGLMFGLLALTDVWGIVWPAQSAGTLSLPMFTLTAILYLVAGLAMHLLVFEDMTYELRRANRQLEVAQAELRQLVITDSLTGCYNRRFFDEIIGRELHRHRRYRTPLSIMFIDVDRFKAVNDILGHEAGDRVLQDVARFLVRHIREADYVFRWGGDEFLALMSCTESEAIRKGLDLQQRFATDPEAATLPSGVGLSIGCVEVPVGEVDILSLIRIADEKMYRDKQSGRRLDRAGGDRSHGHARRRSGS